MSETEIWKDIPELLGRYQASSLGRVRSLRNKYGLKKIPTIVKPEITNNGYYRICTRTKTGKKHYRVHRLVLSAFMQLYEEYRDLNGCLKRKITVDHLDENKLNNRPENLEPVTARENYFRYRERLIRGKQTNV